MILLVIAIVLFLMVLFVPIRLVVLHPFKTVKYLVIDIWKHFAYHKKYIYDGGKLNCYFAHFGGGKTLSVTEYVEWLYRRYNNRKVYDEKRKKWVLQKVHVISNVALTHTPYEHLSTLSQVVNCAYQNKKIDEEHNTRTVVLVLLDEASSQLNSRNFKTNIDADFLNTLITSRHFHMSLFYTSQKFKLVDALLRSVTQQAVSCKKIWRFMIQSYYDADELELATDKTLIKPTKRTGFFITDKHYGAYDTLATVDQLKKSVDANEMMSEAEILALRGSLNPDNDAVMNPSKKLRRMRKKTK
uniref:hypothetical protein n=1 Tax=Acetatifactor sp. TaxID=1872090 RepID=UPI0040579E52